MKKSFLVLLLLLNLHSLFAQNNPALDSIAQVCKDLPLDKRIRVTFMGFATDEYNGSGLNEKLTPMLNNALQQVNCFRVIENVQGTIETNRETNYANNSGMSNGSYVTQEGKQLGAQFIIKGEVIDSEAPVAIIVYIVNPETRDILFSKYIEVSKKFKFKKGNGNFDEQQAQFFQNEAVNEAVKFLVSKRDPLLLSNPNNIQASSGSTSETLITLYNAKFISFVDLSNMIGSLASFKSVERTFGKGLATFTVKHSGSSEDLLSEISNKMGNRYEVTSVNHGKISLTAK